MCFGYTEEPDPPASIEFLEIAKNYMLQSNDYRDLSLPMTISSALDLYVDLTTFIDIE